ncbi:unnamed protein product, partial [Polarella glacialis]
MKVNDDQFIFSPSPDEAIDGAHAIVILTEWDEFKTYDYQKFYSKMMKPAFIFDGRNLLDHDGLDRLGFEVHALGKSRKTGGSNEPADSDLCVSSTPYLELQVQTTMVLATCKRPRSFPPLHVEDFVKIKCPNIEADVTSKALNETGFDDAMFNKAVGELSGGWKMRLALACAVSQGADVFLLDEPTNHLDVVAVKWLREFLVREGQGRRLTAMIISHDAAFLNHVCTDIIHFSPDSKLIYYEGNFDDFRTKTKMDADGARDVLNVRGHAGKIEEEAQADEPTAPPGEADADGDGEMRFPIPGKIEGLGSAGKPVATVTNLNFRYFDDSPLILKEVTVRLTMNSRIGVVGRNGAGKSTLLNLLAGELLPPDDESGELSAVWRHRNLRLSYMAQHHFFHLEEFLKSTPLHYMQVRFRNGWDEEAQKRLTLPQTPEEEEYRKEMAVKYGKRGKEVLTLLSRAKKGKSVLYEVHWKGLDDPKQNTYEPISKLRLMGVEKMAAALDDRI